MIAALGFAACFALALVPGLPLGFALFGRRHAAGWIAGALLGYALTAVALWAPVRLGVPSAVTFAAAWLIAAGVVWILSRGLPGPLVPMPAWRRRDSSALACVLLFALAIAVPPFLRVGASDGAGGRLYRAYFTADFVWHTALTSEVAKFASPPRNPYLANRPIHYYWTYFMLPAAAAGAVRGGTDHVETLLKINAIGTAVLFVAAIFLCAWAAVPRAWAVAAGVALAIGASSAEGAFALWRFWQRGVPLGEVRNLNIDALSSWWFGGLRVDGLQRCFWWVPQHSMAYALGLVALTIVTRVGSGAPPAAILGAGLALGGSAMMNPFVGGVFTIVWACAVLVDAVRTGAPFSRIARHALAGVPVGLALAWCVGNDMVEGAGGALQFGWLGEARTAPVATLLLSLGPALACALAGVLVPTSRAHDAGAGAANRPAVAAGALALLALVLLYFVRLDVDRSWVGFRAGQMFLVAVPALVARGLVATGAWRRAAMTVAALAALLGGPTTAIDAYNAQDVANFSESPIGPWTMTITREEREGLEWLRETTPVTAIVQMDPSARERRTWSLIPSSAQRRMAAGQPISLLGGTSAGSEYAEKSARVRTMFASGDAPEAWRIARALRIDYIWVDRVERAAYPSGVAKFDAAPETFAPVFRNAEVTIFRVQ